MTEYLTKNTLPKPVPGNWSVWYRYTYGVAGERFLREINDNRRLMGSFCPQCKKVFLPPSLYCEDCFAEMSEYRPIAGTGTVHTFSVLHESLEETPLAKPIVAAFVQFDGITGGLLAPLEGVSPEKVQIGMKVNVSFNTKTPTKSILDLTWVPA